MSASDGWEVVARVRAAERYLFFSRLDVPGVLAHPSMVAEIYTPSGFRHRSLVAGLTDDQIYAVGVAMNKNKSLLHISFYFSNLYGHLSVQGLTYLFHALAENTTVKILDLRGNNLTWSPAFLPLLKMLFKKNTTLRVLFLQGNELREEHFLIVSDMLRRYNSTI